MSVPLPNLDDRRWVDLVEEGRSLIPFYGPEWTDHNYHCPGITFLELLAWITEMDVYQVNRVPESHVRKFLALVGERPSPPTAARTVEGMGRTAGGSPLHLPSGFQFQGVDPSGQPVDFRTLSDLNVVSQTLEAIQVESRAGFQDLTDRWKRKESLLVFGEDPRPGAAVYFGFNRPLDRHVTITLYAQVDGHAWTLYERRRILAELHDGMEECAVPPPLLSCEETPPPVGSGEVEPLPRHHSAVIVWEMLDTAGQWRPLSNGPAQVADETRSFSLNGRIQIRLDQMMGAKAIGRIPRALSYLRCRLEAGAFDAAPALEDIVMNGVLVEQAVPADPVRQQGSGSPDQTVQCVECTSDVGQSRPIGSGGPNRTVQCRPTPVIESSVRVRTTEKGTHEDWRAVGDLDASSASDRHYRVDASKGLVAFGDGRRGREVARAEAIEVSYLRTKAQAGNVPEATITRVAPYEGQAASSRELSDILNRFAADGGRAGESVTDALARAFVNRERTPRAVTLADYKALALDVPGTRVARAAAWANVHPAFPCFRAPGVITVVILPYLPLARPFPSRGLCEIVSRYLRRRRVVSTRVEVVGPAYTEVRVRATVRSRPGVNKRDLAGRLEAKVNSFFHPLTGGPEKTGWPFGRDVYRSEVLQCLDETPGVDHVVKLEFLNEQGQTLCGNVCLGRFGLVAAGKHEITIE